MSNSITQNDYDSVDISSSISVFFQKISRCFYSEILERSENKGTSPVKILEYMFTLIFKGKSMYMDWSDNESIRSCSL